MKQSSFTFLAVVGVFMLAAVVGDIDGRRVKPWLLEDQSLAGADEIITAWIPIKDYQYFGLGFVFKTDCTYFETAIDDSLGFDIDYEVSYIADQPTTNEGFYPYSLGSMPEVMSFTITDTTEKYESLTNQIRQYQSLHVISTPLSPAYWIRFHIEKDAIHEKTVASLLKYSLYFFRQP